MSHQNKQHDDPILEVLHYLSDQTWEDPEFPPREYVQKTDLAGIPSWGIEGVFDGDAAADGCPFPPDSNLSRRIRLWQGDACSLDVGGVAFDFSYKSFKSGIGHRMIQLGGGKMAQEMHHVEKMRSGDVQMAKGNLGNLHCQKIVPFVGPNFKPQFRNAARNTLCNATRNILLQSRDEGLATLALPCMYAEEKNFPIDECAHIVLRTLRRWLPKVPEIQAIVLYANTTVERAAYERILPVYFPRSTADSMRAMDETLKVEQFNWGNELGEEPVSEERQLHVSALVKNRDEDREDDDEAEDLMNFDASFEKKEVERLDANLWDTENPDDLQHIYCRYVREAGGTREGKEMCEELDKLGFLTCMGKDNGGKEVVLFTEALLPIARYEQEDILKYIVYRLDPISNEDFSVVYAHGGVSQSQNFLDMWKEVLKLAQFKYAVTLQNFLVLHPTLAFKASFAVLSFYLPPEIWNNTVYCETVDEVKRYVGLREYQFPNCVTMYERERNQSIFGSLW